MDLLHSVDVQASQRLLLSATKHAYIDFQRQWQCKADYKCEPYTQQLQ
jgi:hypothetical protein